MIRRTKQQKLDWEMALAISREARSKPDSPYAGKFVAVSKGQVVAVADSIDEIEDCMVELELGPGKGTWIEASADYESPIYIWTLGR